MPLLHVKLKRQNTTLYGAFEPADVLLKVKLYIASSLPGTRLDAIKLADKDGTEFTSDEAILSDFSYITRTELPVINFTIGGQ